MSQPTYNASNVPHTKGQTKKGKGVRVVTTIIRYSLLTLALSWGAFAWAATLELVQAIGQTTHLPQGIRRPMIYFQLRSTNGDATLNTMTINNSGTCSFGPCVSRVAIYRDAIGQGLVQQFDDTIDPLVASSVIPNSNNLSNLILSIQNEIIPSNNTQGYFLVYDILDSAPLGQDCKAVLLDFTSNATILGPPSTEYTAMISGFSSTLITPHTNPLVALPGQANVPGLLLQLKTSGEGVKTHQFKLSVDVGSAMVVTTAGSKNGITGARLYRANNNSTTTFSKANAESNQSVYTLLSQLNSTDMTSSQSVTFELKTDNSNAVVIQQDTTANFFVTFDIGENTVVTTNTTISPQVTLLSGIGDNSVSPLRLFSPQPIVPGNILIGGLAYNPIETKPIFNSDAHYGRRSVINMMQIELEAHQVQIGIATMNILNGGSVPFRVAPTDPKNIQRIEVYHDSNKSRSLETNLDTKISDTLLGGGFNQIDSAVVTFNLLSQTNGVLYIPARNPNNSGYFDSNATQLYVVYTMGEHIMSNQSTSFGSGSYAISRIANISGQAVIDGDVLPIKLSGSLPVVATPEAKVTIEGALNVILTDALKLSPSKVIQGQIKVPMLKVSLDSSDRYLNTTLTLKNESETFSPSQQGVSRIWVYNDNNQNNVVDGPDVLLSAVDNPINRQTVTIPNIPINTGQNNWIILYDIGALTPIPANNALPSIRAQIASMNSEANFKFGGQDTPYPNPAISTQVESSRLSIDGIAIAQTNQAVLTQFNMVITVNNKTANPVTLYKIEPRIYFSTISGSDITYEFTIATLNNAVVYPYSLAPFSSVGVPFSVTHTKRISDGTAVIDGLAEYAVDDSIAVYPLASPAIGRAMLTRYPAQAGWTAASPNTPRFNIASLAQYRWSLPGYISKVEVDTNGTPSPFTNGDAISKQSALRIRLANNGNNINEASIQVKLNGLLLSKSSQLNTGAPSYGLASTQFSYNAENGEINIADVGNQNGNVVISVSDTQGNPLPDLTLSFRIKAVVELLNPLFYPNPYVKGRNIPLRLGLQLTQPATVKLIVYNHLGRKIYESNNTFTGIGYQEIIIPTNSEVMASGMYLCKVIATGSDGTRSVATTKLAVY